MLKLTNNWIIWEHQKNNGMNYEQNTCKIGNFQSIETFWNYFNTYPNPSNIFYNGIIKPRILNPEREVSSISIFKEGIEPKWEDPKNNDGAEISLRKFKNLDELDKLWENLTIYLIGELFSDSKNITGIRVVDSSIPNRKSLYRIELWFDNKKIKDSIIDEFKKKLKIIDNDDIHFKEHSTAIESTPMHYKNKYKYTKKLRGGK